MRDGGEERSIPETADTGERRPHERRWRSAVFILVERRKGSVRRYGSMLLAAVLLVIAALMHVRLAGWI